MNYSRRKMIKAAGLSVGALSVPLLSDAAQKENRTNTNGDMKDKVAFITGGARGMGLATAIELAGKGVQCALYDVAQNIPTVKYDLATDDDLKKAKESVEALGVSCLTFKGDVRDFSALQKAVDATVEEFGRLDFVIANAGVTRNGNLASHTVEETNDLFEINVGGVINIINAASSHLISQKSGRIVTISSIAGKKGIGGFPVYGATKWAVIGLSKSMAVELGPLGITCNIICPGFVDTALLHNDHMLKMFGDTDNEVNAQRLEAFAQNTNKLSTGFLQPEEIASMVAYLCSENARNITGETFVVDAGNIL